MADIKEIVRGFARTKEQETAIRAYGLPARAIFAEGVGAESLEACLSTFRDRPGRLVIARDMRIFGETKRLVSAAMKRLEQAGIRVVDITHPEDATISQLLERAHIAISSTRFSGDRPRARRQGRDGGFAKGRCAQARRDSFVPPRMVDQIVDEPTIPWTVKVRILSPHFSESTLRRRYGAARRGRG